MVLLTSHRLLPLQVAHLQEVHEDISEAAAHRALEECAGSEDATAEALADSLFKHRVQVHSYTAEAHRVYPLMWCASVPVVQPLCRIYSCCRSSHTQPVSPGVAHRLYSVLGVRRIVSTRVQGLHMLLQVAVGDRVARPAPRLPVTRSGDGNPTSRPALVDSSALGGVRISI